MDAFNVYTSRFLEVIDSLKISDYQVWNNLESLSRFRLKGGAKCSLFLFYANRL